MAVVIVCGDMRPFNRVPKARRAHRGDNLNDPFCAFYAGSRDTGIISRGSCESSSLSVCVRNAGYPPWPAGTRARCTIRYHLVKYSPSFSSRNFSRKFRAFPRKSFIEQAFLGRKVAVVYRIRRNSGGQTLGKNSVSGRREVSDSNSISRLAVPFL